MILVVGGGGPVGAQVVTQLLEQGEAVRATSRDPSKFECAPDASVVRADLDEPESIVEAFEACDQAFVVLPTMGGEAREHWDQTVVTAARAAGTERVVRVSVVAVEDESAKDEQTGFHRKGESTLADSGLKWNALRAGQFMSNALSWTESIKAEAFVREPFAHVKQAPVDPYDVASVGVACLTEAELPSGPLAITGPEALSLFEQVQIVASLLGQTLDVIDWDPSEARETFINRGMPGEMVDGIMHHMEDPTGIHAKVSTTVEQFCGRPANSFRDWAFANIEHFRKD